jgi:excinuclease ABC subunit C
MKTTEKINSILNSLPDKPGIYQFFDQNDTVLYVGKAKNLKKRVASYFNKNQDTAKLRILVRKIKDIRTIIVNSEQDALLLENNLIKKYQPKYNVQLKDDKSYPWICIKNEPFPRVFKTRTIINDGSSYFGPYTSVHMINTLLDLFRQLYKLRTCKLKLTQENIKKRKFKVCLELHIGNCKGPCVGLQKADNYNESIEHIRKILKGNIYQVIQYLNKLMNKYADAYKFEEAYEIKSRIDILEKYQSKSTIVNPKINNVDVFAIVEDEKFAYVNFFKVMNGAIIQAQTLEMKKRLHETKEDLLQLAITEINRKLHSEADELILPFEPEYQISTKVTVPKQGDKRRLLELSERNAKYFRFERIREREKKEADKKTSRVLNRIQQDLRLLKLPGHIECFDNSNFQGQYPVASCVVFKNALPSKKDYRHFNIKSVDGINDFASMEEVIFRRYKRLIDEEQSLPQLIIVDGGKGQLSSAVKSLKKLGIYHLVSIIGIAKRLEEIYFPDDSVPLYLNKNSESLKLIQQLRNEAHRFGINFHRNKRSQSIGKSMLTNIPAIGPKTRDVLIRKFRSVNKLKSASFEELKKCVGETKANNIINYFRENEIE